MTTTFQFNTVSEIRFGPGSISGLGDIARKLSIKHAFLVSDPGIVQHDLLRDGIHSLESGEVKTTVYSAVTADPPEETVLEAAEAARQAGCDGIIGFGGGSSMDTAKLVAVLVSGQQTLATMYGVDQVRATRLPLIQVPTTAGTGSEVTPISIVTTGETTKSGVVSWNLLADCVVLDPELTIGLPPHVTAATGIDAMVHAIEAYTSKRLKNPMSDLLACRALRLLSANIGRAVSDGEDLDARGAMLLGAMLAGQAFANAPVAAVHALAYPLGGIFHIPHGLSNSLVLPHVLRFNASAAARHYRELLPHIISTSVAPEDDEEASSMLAAHFDGLAGELGLPTRLNQLDIDEDALPVLAEQAMLQQRLLVNNPREMTENAALAIYREAY